MKQTETQAIVLDFLPHGHPFEERRIPIAQVVGLQHFTILEVIPKKDVFLKPGDDVYIGEDKREKIHHVKGRVKIKDLTRTAQAELKSVIEEVVTRDEKKYVDFFNKSGPISTRLHQVELLPGIGKKHMWKIIEERRYEPFESFKDLQERVDLLPDPKQAIVKRILEELDDLDKYKLFTA
ncbi:DUF655 domain-containing protein [archaeon CG10_big_fil_rev_8_21_14_0_10_43_11]|nr:MAG: DUF655 domain-containing protein [archaeon CG10_big_fil_rev_8_21_14_0_10_43_11]